MGSRIPQHFLAWHINGLNLWVSQWASSVQVLRLAGFPGWVIRLVRNAAVAAVLRADRELQLCSHGHLRNSKKEFEPEGMLVSFAPRLLNLSKELIDNRCTYLPFRFYWSMLFFCNRIFSCDLPRIFLPLLCILMVSILCVIKRLWKSIISCLTRFPPKSASILQQLWRLQFSRCFHQRREC